MVQQRQVSKTEYRGLEGSRSRPAMNQIVELLCGNWLGTIVAIGGIGLAIFFHWRSKTIGRLAIVSHDVALIDGDSEGFPSEVVIQYRNEEVQRVSSSTIWIWNDGNGTVRRNDIAESDPLSLKFSGNILNQKIRNITPQSLQAVADTPQSKKGIVQYDFEFLNPNDGFALEVVHTGDSGPPECLGTIMNPSRRPRYKGRAYGTAADWQEKLGRTLTFFLMLGFLLMGIVEFLGVQYDEIISFLDREEAPPWAYGTMGIAFGILMALMLWFTRRRIPLSILIDNSEKN